jgi:hypothetical protein
MSKETNSSEMEQELRTLFSLTKSNPNSLNSNDNKKKVRKFLRKWRIDYKEFALLLWQIIKKEPKIVVASASPSTTFVPASRTYYPTSRTYCPDCNSLMNHSWCPLCREFKENHQNCPKCGSLVSITGWCFRCYAYTSI